MGETLVRDVLELLIVVAVGGMLVTSVRRLRAGRLRVNRCPACGRPCSRVYARCPHCGT